MIRRVQRRTRSNENTRSLPTTQGLLSYFDPADASATGGNVDSLASRSGSVACTISSTGTNRPTLSTVSGKTWLSFASASSQRLSETSSSLAAALGGVSAYTVYSAVQRNDPAGGLNGTFFGWSTAAGSSYALHTTQGPNKDQYSRSESGASTNNITAGSPWTTGYGVYASTFDGSGISGYFDMSLLQSAANSRNVGAASIFCIGSYVLASGSFGGYLDGKLGITMVYSGVHQITQMAIISAWLRVYYGI